MQSRSGRQRKIEEQCARHQQISEPEIFLRKLDWRGAAVRLVTVNGQRDNNDAALNEFLPEALR